MSARPCGPSVNGVQEPTSELSTVTITRRAGVVPPLSPEILITFQTVCLPAGPAAVACSGSLQSLLEASF